MRTNSSSSQARSDALSEPLPLSIHVIVVVDQIESFRYV